ncbi:hypothetical protein BC937DRAFT_91729 [Endogone sp. FLAS-F59071]|nr:hypothetical protein BC937DRAFT_91729 [Endogone sp. FLAS-F59071]|eukprot:RUS15985.1 hypothetical protein BC937DRAFT_91729 [Endogone sp. FLAS-F59071]
MTHFQTLQPELTEHSLNLVQQLSDNVQGFKSVFSCNGAVTPQHLKLFYKEKSPSTKVYAQSFPCSGEALEPLLNLCEPATFGKGHETVLDKDYRNALHLDPSKFGLNFMPSQFGILEQVRRYMMPSNVGIRDELYKLNIYGPGGHFKSHVDTPRDGGMFGSLVVCFPVEFEGGQLVVQHKQTQNTFDWSSRGAPQNADVQWAAFFADCEHKILPVTSGYRLTLTYNLYTMENDRNVGDSISGFSSESTAFHQTLASSIVDPHFMENGGILGFGLQHAYPIKDEPEFSTKFDKILKGTDAMIYVVAKKLGLTVSVLPVYPYDAEESGIYDNDNVFEGKIPKRSKRIYFTSPGCFPRKGEDICWEYLNFSEPEVIISHFDGHNRTDITWCVLPNTLIESNTYFAFGNDGCMNAVYVGAVMLITIPPLGAECRQEVTKPSTD